MELRLQIIIIILQINFYNKMNKKLLNFSKLFETAEITDPTNNKSILFKSLWEKNDRNLLVITFLRRFG